MIRLRRDMPAEEVIGSYQNMSRSGYGKGFMIRSGKDVDMGMGRHVFMKDGGQHNLYDPYCEEAPLGPHQGLDDESAMSVTSSQRALSYQGNIRKQKKNIRNSIENALNSSKPKWMTKNYQDPNTQFNIGKAA